jgi:hypothetical protein
LRVAPGFRFFLRIGFKLNWYGRGAPWARKIRQTASGVDSHKANSRFTPSEVLLIASPYRQFNLAGSPSRFAQRLRCTAAHPGWYFALYCTSVDCTRDFRPTGLAVRSALQSSRTVRGPADSYRSATANKKKGVAWSGVARVGVTTQTARRPGDPRRGLVRTVSIVSPRATPLDIISRVHYRTRATVFV